MSQYTVLFVDDEPFILTSLQRLFRGDPMRILTCSSAKEALKLIKLEPIQLLVTDNVMPGMTGVELAKQVKLLRPEVLRIILSGQSDMDAVLTAINEGEAYRFILKPWNDLDLKITVNVALAQYKLVQDNRRLAARLQSQTELLIRLRLQHPDLLKDIPQEQVQDVDRDEESWSLISRAEKELLPCPKL